MQSVRVLGVSGGSSEWTECEHVEGRVNRDPDASIGPQGCPRVEHTGLE